MSKQYSILILFCCLALVAVSCAPAPEPAEELAPVMEEEVVEEVIPTDTPLPPTEEPEVEEDDNPVNQALTEGEAVLHQFRGVAYLESGEVEFLN